MVISKNKTIGLSVVQGSGIGPVLYAVMKSDLQAISKLNTLFKYADAVSYTHLTLPTNREV